MFHTKAWGVWLLAALAPFLLTKNPFYLLLAILLVSINYAALARHNPPIRFTATRTPTFVTPSATFVRASATVAPSPTLTRVAIVRMTPTWTRGVAPAPTLAETATPLLTLIARVSTRVVPTDMPPDNRRAQDEAWGSALRLAGIALTGGLLCGALVVVFVVTLVVLRRVM